MLSLYYNLLINAVKVNQKVIKASVFALFYILLTYKILLPPVKGLPNNGDFWRLTNSIAVDEESPGKGRFVSQYYKYGFENKFKYWTSAYFFPTIAKIFSGFFKNKKNYFDIRQMGLSYLLLYFLLLVSIAKRQFIWGVVVTFFMLDRFVLLGFNSFYINTFVLVFFIATLAIRENEQSLKSNILLVVLGSFFSQAGSAYIHLGILWFLLVLIKINLSSIKLKDSMLAVLCFVLINFAYYNAQFISKSQKIEKLVKYDSIFFGIGKITNTEEFKEDLEYLGIPKEFAAYQEKQYFYHNIKVKVDGKKFNKEDLRIRRASRLKIIWLMIKRGFFFKLLPHAFNRVTFYERTYPNQRHGVNIQGRSFLWRPWFNSFDVRNFVWSKFSWQSFFLIQFFLMIFYFYIFVKHKNYESMLLSFLATMFFANIVFSFFGTGFMGLGRHLLISRVCALLTQLYFIKMIFINLLNHLTSLRAVSYLRTTKTVS